MSHEAPPALTKRDREAFERDGSLRDIYIANTDTSDWQRCVDHVRHRYSTRFLCDNENVTFPDDVHEVFQLCEEKAVTLQVDVGGLSINTHFFGEEEIEFDLDPREVKTQRDVDSVMRLLVELGDLLGKQVVLTPENMSEVPIYRFTPGSDAPEYVPPSFP